MDSQTSDSGRRGRAPTVTAAERAQARDVSLRRIGRLFTAHRLPLAVVTAIIVVSSVLSLASPFLLREVIDVALPRADLPLLSWLVAGMVAVAALTSALGVVQTWISTVVGQRVMHRLRTDVFAHLHRQSVAFFTRTRTGEVRRDEVVDMDPPPCGRRTRACRASAAWTVDGPRRSAKQRRPPISPTLTSLIGIIVHRGHDFNSGCLHYRGLV